MKKVITLVALVSLPILAACNTVEGLGKDIQVGGEKIENSAEKHK